MEIKGIRPGNFTPKCTKCTKKFLLTVSSDPSVDMKVSALKEAEAPSVKETIAPARATVAKTQGTHDKPKAKAPAPAHAAVLASANETLPPEAIADAVRASLGGDDDDDDDNSP